jgi:hypothetical protein
MPAECVHFSFSCEFWFDSNRNCGTLNGKNTNFIIDAIYFVTSPEDWALKSLI